MSETLLGVSPSKSEDLLRGAVPGRGRCGRPERCRAGVPLRWSSLAEPSEEELAIARELVRSARARGVAMTGPGGMLKALTKTVIETALDEEMADHLGYDKHDPTGRGSWELPQRHAELKTVLTDNVGPVTIEVPRDRDGSFDPVIVKKRQRRLGGVDTIVLSLVAKGLTTGEVSATSENRFRVRALILGVGTPPQTSSPFRRTTESSDCPPLRPSGVARPCWYATRCASLRWWVDAGTAGFLPTTSGVGVRDDESASRPPDAHRAPATRPRGSRLV